MQLEGVSIDNSTKFGDQPNVRQKARVAADALRSFIENGLESGSLKIGDQIPTERELMEKFGGGRNIVRKTLITLEKEGKIIRRVGSGTFITDPNSNDISCQKLSSSSYLSDIAQSAGPVEVMELRLTFEPSAAELAANRASARETEKIRAAYEKSLTAGSIKSFEAADDSFHQAIAESCRNVLFEKVYDIVSVVRNKTEWGIMKENSLSPKHREVHSQEHLEILTAIEHRDGRAAHRAMIHHLESVKSMLFSTS